MIPASPQELKATLRDVARLAGVSPMTVSRAITSRGVVKEATRELVMSAVRELNYQPNFAARDLATRDVLRIAILYANPSSAYLSAFLLGLIENASEIGCQLVVEYWDEALNSSRLLEKLRLTSVSGVILTPPLSDSDAILSAIQNENIPLVSVAPGRNRDGFSSVSIDDFTAAQAMTRHLIDLGHSTIGFISGDYNLHSAKCRQDGFIHAMSHAGLKIRLGDIQPGNFTYRSGMQAAGALLARQDRPTAIFAANDDMAAGALSMAHSLGLNVPSELSVAGFDDTAIATTVWPELTTIHQPIKAMAHNALHILKTSIRNHHEGVSSPISHVVSPFSLVDRLSCAPPPMTRM